MGHILAHYEIRVRCSGGSRLSTAEAETTKGIEPGIITDYDLDGHLTGIDVLSASKCAIPAVCDNIT